MKLSERWQEIIEQNGQLNGHVDKVFEKFAFRLQIKERSYFLANLTH